ncbi:Virus attachment protein p12 family protein [Lachnospiraceae bacterium A10]|nr:Virus attachment protein p12 family protein [Lachnospiraceae bacterium A10]
MSGTLISILIAVIIAVVLVLDIRFILKKKKQGTCIGCPESKCAKCSCHAEK